MKKNVILAKGNNINLIWNVIRLLLIGTYSVLDLSDK